MFLDWLAYFIFAATALMAIGAFCLSEREAKVRFIISVAITGALLWALLRLF